jgi:hypothetical protein
MSNGRRQKRVGGGVAYLQRERVRKRQQGCEGGCVYTHRYVLHMFRYLRIWIESHYGKGGGLNNLRVLVPSDDDQHFLQRQACGREGEREKERKGGGKGGGGGGVLNK